MSVSSVNTHYTRCINTILQLLAQFKKKLGEYWTMVRRCPVVVSHEISCSAEPSKKVARAAARRREPVVIILHNLNTRSSDPKFPTAFIWDHRRNSCFQ